MVDVPYQPVDCYSLRSQDDDLSSDLAEAAPRDSGFSSELALESDQLAILDLDDFRFEG